MTSEQPKPTEQDLEIPSLAELDSSRPDYFQGLDKGYTDLVVLSRQQIVRAQYLLEGLGRDLQTRLRGIEGVFIKNEIPLKDEVTRDNGKVVGRDYIEAIILEGAEGSNDLDVRRKIEDVVTAVRRGYENKKRVLEDDVTRIKRAGEDFWNAILGLTKITPLTDINILNDTLHYYIAGGKNGEIYEAHVTLPFDSDKEFSVSEPFRNQYLTKHNFSDPGFLRDFAKQSEGINANAYFVENPSTIPNQRTLFYFAFAEYTLFGLGEIGKVMNAQAEQEKASPVSALINSIKEGMGKLSIKDFLGRKSSD